MLVPETNNDFRLIDLEEIEELINTLECTIVIAESGVPISTVTALEVLLKQIKGWV